MELIKVIILELIIAYMIFCTIYFTIMQILIRANGPDKTTQKKFKQICKWEHRDTLRQETLVISEYIEQYAKEHNIHWSEFI